MVSNKRLKYLRKRLGYSQREFSDSLGIQQGSYSDVERGKVAVSPALMVSLIKHYKINPVWLVEGKGSIYLESNKAIENNNPAEHTELSVNDENAGEVEPITYQGFPAPKVTSIDENGEEKILMVNANALTDYPKKLHDPEFIEQLPNFICPEFKKNDRNYRCFQMAGDKMNPTIFHKDWLIARHESISEIRSAEVYVIVDHHDVKVYRILNFLEAKNIIVVSADNDYYPAKEIGLADVQELWHVEAKLSYNLFPGKRQLKMMMQKMELDLEELTQKIEELSKKMRGADGT